MIGANPGNSRPGRPIYRQIRGIPGFPGLIEGRIHDSAPARGYARHPMDADYPPGYLMVLCTCPSQSAAGAIATALLEERLAACVNQLPGVKSMYRWKDRVETDDEVLLLIKTTTRNFAGLEDTINRLHPYELPEIIGVPLTAGSDAYFDWIDNSTR
jgi:periplasmic divalent cation tolerance protein